MTSPYQSNNNPRRKPEKEVDIPLWQLVIGGISLTLGGILAGITIAEIALSIWMPELSR